MKLTLEEAKAMMDRNNDGGLYLRDTEITALQDNLNVRGSRDVREKEIEGKGC